MTLRLLLALLLAAAVVGGVIWLRADARADLRADQARQSAEDRARVLRQSGERRHDVENLADDELRDALRRRVRPAGTAQ